MQQALVRRAPGRPSEKESEAIRLQILQTATEVFTSVGYEQASMEMIADAAGSTKTTMYRLFSSKENLFAAAINRALGRAREKMPPFLTDERPPAIVLIEIARAIAEGYRESGIGALWRTVLSAKRRFPALYEAVHAEMQPATTAVLIAEYLTAADTRGVMRVPQAKLAADQFMVLVGPALDMVDQRDYRGEAWIKSVVAMFCATYVVDEPSYTA